ncbi:MAG TPA: hypothetical protein V6C81_07170 [Planktothrix sp.]|jgi:hypothetical protein
MPDKEYEKLKKQKDEENANFESDIKALYSEARKSEDRGFVLLTQISKQLESIENLLRARLEK